MPESMIPRERRAERTRKAILDAAMQLIVEKGPEKLSLREVARRIDYSPAGLYEYYGSKAELIEAACREADVRLSAYLQSVPTNLPVGTYLLELGLAYVQFARKNPEHFLFLFSHREANFDELLSESTSTAEAGRVWAEHDYNFGLLYNAVIRAIDIQVIFTHPGYGPLEIAYTVWAAAHGLATLQTQYLHNLPIDYEVAERHALRLMIAGLSQPP